MATLIKNCKFLRILNGLFEKKRGINYFSYQRIHVSNFDLFTTLTVSFPTDLVKCDL